MAFHLQVLKSYRGGISKSVTVFNENTTVRLLLKPGNDYIVFATRNHDGVYEAVNYCGEVQNVDGEPYSAKLEERIQELKRQTSSVIEGEVRDRDWGIVLGARLTLVGNNTKEDVTVDKDGHFSIAVAPGTYRVLIPGNLHVSDYSWSVTTRLG